MNDGLKNFANSQLFVSVNTIHKLKLNFNFRSRYVEEYEKSLSSFVSDVRCVIAV